MLHIRFVEHYISVLGLIMPRKITNIGFQRIKINSHFIQNTIVLNTLTKTTSIIKPIKQGFFLFVHCLNIGESR